MRIDLTQAPVALLPSSITEVQLRELLTKCPSFDAAQMDKNTELMAKVDTSDPTRVTIPDGVVFPPSIGFDYPGFRGEVETIPTDETATRLQALAKIVAQPQADYNAGIRNPSPTP
jgi:hypothetical protein